MLRPEGEASYFPGPDGLRFHLLMALAGFLGGLAVVMPLVLWLVSEPGSRPPVSGGIAGEAKDKNEASGGTQDSKRPSAAYPQATPAASKAAVAHDLPALAVLRQKAIDTAPPGSAGRSSSSAPPLPGENAGATANAGQSPDRHASVLESARNKMRAGDVVAARRLLQISDLSANGPALFMLAETYDPTVLAALGTPGLMAQAPTARRYYESALALGVTAAAMRLEQLK